MVLASGEGLKLHPNIVESVAWETEQACSLKQVPYSCHKATRAITGGQPLWLHPIPSASYQWPTSNTINILSLEILPLVSSTWTLEDEVKCVLRREADNMSSKPHPVP